MAVTYNWGYKPSLANKYGLVIPASADDARPTGYCYVAHWGNDTSGNGSRQKPYKTITKAVTLGANTTIILGSGTYRESTIPVGVQGISLIGDGNVIIDISFTTYFTSGTNSFSRIYNIKFVGSNSYVHNGFYGLVVTTILDSLFLSTSLTPSGLGSNYSGNAGVTIRNSTFIYCRYIGTQGHNNNKVTATVENCTFYQCNLLLAIKNAFNNIFQLCNIAILPFDADSNPRYSLFYQCNFKFLTASGQAATGGGLYPTTPPTYSYYGDMASLKSAALLAYPDMLDIFSKSNMGDAKFNNATIDDLTLAFDSPARNMSYFGAFIGAFSITKSLAVKSSASLSAFDNSSAINLTIADNSLTLVDVDVNASIVTKPIDNTAGREMQKLHTFGINADRNGEYVDSTADLANTTISAGTTLTVSTPYLVEVGAITYDGNVYNAGQRFTSKSSSPGTFTTSTSGIVREILEAPARENVEARFSDGAITTVDNTATLEELAWYFVEGNAVTYNGNSYAVGAFIKVLTGITSFTGTGLLRKVFSDTDTYFYFEINQKPTSNNVGNNRTGAIVRGNGDKDFDRTAANVFPINKKFIQLRYTIQVNNLTP